MILNTVCQHNCFSIQGSYTGYVFRLIDQSSSGIFSTLSRKFKSKHVAYITTLYTKTVELTYII